MPNCAAGIDLSQIVASLNNIKFVALVVAGVLALTVFAFGLALNALDGLRSGTAGRDRVGAGKRAMWSGAVTLIGIALFPVVAPLIGGIFGGFTCG